MAKVYPDGSSYAWTPEMGENGIIIRMSKSTAGSYDWCVQQMWLQQNNVYTREYNGCSVQLNCTNVTGALEGTPVRAASAGGDHALVLTEAQRSIDEAVSGALSDVIEMHDFRGKAGASAVKPSAARSWRQRAAAIEFF